MKVFTKYNIANWKFGEKYVLSQGIFFCMMFTFKKIMDDLRYYKFKNIEGRKQNADSLKIPRFLKDRPSQNLFHC